MTLLITNPLPFPYCLREGVGGWVKKYVEGLGGWVKKYVEGLGRWVNKYVEGSEDHQYKPSEEWPESNEEHGP